MRARGFTLVELLIAMVIAAILLMLALPTYTEFMRNTRIRSTADSLAGGMRLAQAEAVRRNQDVELIVDPAVGWTIRDPIAPQILHDEPFSEAGAQVVIDPNPPAADRLTYSALGQLLPTNRNDGDSATMTSIAISHAAAPSRALRVITEFFGQGVRVCDKDGAVHATLQCPGGVP